MSKPRDYTLHIERMRTGRWTQLLDDEALVRETLQSKALLRRRKLRGSRTQLIELEEARYSTGLEECKRRGVGSLAGQWFRPRANLSFGIGVEFTEEGSLNVKHEQPPERERRKRKPLPPAPADGGELLELLERSVAEAVNGNGNSSNGNGKHQ